MEKGSWVEVEIDDHAPKTLEELLNRYLKDISSKKKGFQDETYRMKKVMSEPMAKVPLARLSPAMIASWRDKRLESVSGPTVRKDMAILNHAISLSMREWGVDLRSNPMTLVSKPVSSKARERRLSGKEYDRLMESLETCRNTWIKPLVEFALETAMRRGEILSLVWENVNLDSRVAFLPETKNGENRNVPLSQKALDILQSLPRETEYVFNTTAYSVRMAFERALKRAEIEDFRFHDLRHEATSRLFEKDLNIMEVSSITGHKDLGMLKRYTHLRAEDLALRL